MVWSPSYDCPARTLNFANQTLRLSTGTCTPTNITLVDSPGATIQVSGQTLFVSASEALTVLAGNTHYRLGNISDPTFTLTGTGGINSAGTICVGNLTLTGNSIQECGGQIFSPNANLSALTCIGASNNPLNVN